MEVKKNDRLVVSIHLLQRSVAVQIDRAWVELDAPPANLQPPVMYAAAARHF